ncbi:hypothetical protein HRI_005083700 [Hibiscus trionum]|uniref:F-box domain-containing protein n=1 Tax=Hibiscus trionum TaxID=183268 RepID=A0A9W7JI46_HIBTR|nr:hypothetical protein HRI_005083700 [Hibiscus trionum]
MSTIMYLVIILLQMLRRGRAANPNGDGRGFKHLGDDMVVEILRRVPADQLWCSCRKVCSRWKALISSSEFVQAHLRQSPTTFFVFIKQERPVWSCTGQKELDFFFPRDDNAKASAVTKIVSNGPLVKRWRHQMRGQAVVPVSSCNGLILFKSCSDSSDEFYVGNPITGELVSRKHLGRKGRLCGFFYNSSTREYRVYYYHWTGYTSTNPIEYAVLTLGSNSRWRILHHLPYRVRDRAIVLNNTIYWLIADMYQPESRTFDHSECRESILSCSMDSGKFLSWAHPASYHCLKREWHKRMELLEMEGRPTCCCLHGLEGKLWIFHISDTDDHAGTWTRIYNLNFIWDRNIFPFTSTLVDNQDIQLVNIGNKQVLLVWFKRGVFRYDLQSGRVTRVRLPGISEVHYGVSLTSYTKSLVMLNNICPLGLQQ